MFEHIMFLCCTHTYKNELNNYTYSIISLIIPLVGFLASWWFWKKNEIKFAKNVFLVFCAIEWLYLFYFGDIFIDDSFYSNIICEFGFLIIGIFLIEPIRDALNAKAKEAEIISDKQVVLTEPAISESDDNNIEFTNIDGINDVRKVVRAIMTSNYRFRSAEAIAKQVKLTVEQVQGILDVLFKHKYAKKVKGRNGKVLWGIILE